MRCILAALLALVTITALAFPAIAQEPAKYNFASVQGARNIQVLPGDEVNGYVYFYNIDGNRITHVTLEVSEAPDGWLVEIQPPLGETQVEVNGQVVSVTENLYVEPSEAQEEETKDVPGGMVCIPVATRGYALAKEAQVIIRVPETEAIGTTGEITVSAVARWLGQGGAVAFNQSRDFNFTVEVVSERTDFEEKILPSGGGIGKWWPTITGVAVVVLGAALILLYVRRRRE
jgi:hypothetical protein